MRIAHIFNAICNDIPRRERIEHAAMTHSYSVIYCNGIELCRKASGLLYNTLNILTGLMQMHVARNKLCKGVYNSNYRFSHLASLHSVGKPKSPCSGHLSTFKGYTAS